MEVVERQPSIHISPKKLLVPPTRKRGPLFLKGMNAKVVTLTRDLLMKRFLEVITVPTTQIPSSKAHSNTRCLVWKRFNILVDIQSATCWNFQAFFGFLFQWVWVNLIWHQKPNLFLHFKMMSCSYWRFHFYQTDLEFQSFLYAGVALPFRGL